VSAEGSGSHSSSSGLTTDDIGHLLEKYDIESQVQGEKFVPKQLDLTRLNVNDLSRKDLLTTKRIRVRQVDIGGALQVGIGNASKDAMDDENRFLRQQLTNLQAAQQQTQQTVGNLQVSLDGSKAMLQGSIGQVQATVSTLTNNVSLRMDQIQILATSKISACQLCIKYYNDEAPQERCTPWTSTVASDYTAGGLYCNKGGGCGYLLRCRA